MNTPLDIKIYERVYNLMKKALAGKWTKEVQQFDKEQEIKAVNKAIKDRRGIE